MNADLPVPGRKYHMTLKGIHFIAEVIDVKRSPNTTNHFVKYRDHHDRIQIIPLKVFNHGRGVLIPE